MKNLFYFSLVSILLIFIAVGCKKSKSNDIIIVTDPAKVESQTWKVQSKHSSSILNIGYTDTLFIHITNNQLYIAKKYTHNIWYVVDTLAFTKIDENKIFIEEAFSLNGYYETATIQLEYIDKNKLRFNFDNGERWELIKSYINYSDIPFKKEYSFKGKNWKLTDVEGKEFDTTQNLVLEIDEYGDIMMGHTNEYHFYNNFYYGSITHIEGPRYELSEGSFLVEENDPRTIYIKHISENEINIYNHSGIKYKFAKRNENFRIPSSLELAPYENGEVVDKTWKMDFFHNGNGTWSYENLEFYFIFTNGITFGGQFENNGFRSPYTSTFQILDNNLLSVERGSFFSEFEASTIQLRFLTEDILHIRNNKGWYWQFHAVEKDITPYMQ